KRISRKAGRPRENADGPGTPAETTFFGILRARPICVVGTKPRHRSHFLSPMRACLDFGEPDEAGLFSASDDHSGGTVTRARWLRREQRRKERKNKDRAGQDRLCHLIFAPLSTRAKLVHRPNKLVLE